MKRTILLSMMMIITSAIMYAQPPYWGTSFIDPDIITPSDPSAIESTTYTGQGMVTMYDRRVSNWVTVNAYLFDVVWDDGLTSVAQINPEFGDVPTATIEAEKYAFLVGQLPHCLREYVHEIWIHQGVELFGGGGINNPSILIHTGQSVNYEDEGIIEEILVHEATHTSLEPYHAGQSDWFEAQDLDDEFISQYAEDNPNTEDIAESFGTWLAVRFREDSISVEDYNIITQTIPNRLLYFDSIICDLYPFAENTTSINTIEANNFKIYPNPVTDIIYVNGNDIDKDDIKIYNLLGQDFTGLISYVNGKLNVADLPNGYYVLRIKTYSSKVYKL